MCKISGMDHEGEGHKDVWQLEGEGHETVWHHEGEGHKVYGIIGVGDHETVRHYEREGHEGVCTMWGWAMRVIQ